MIERGAGQVACRRYTGHMIAATPAPDPQDARIPGRDRQRRSLILCVIGAAIGTALALPGVLRGDGVVALPPEDVAMVNGVPILRADFTALPGSHSPGVAVRRATLDTMIDEELAVQQGLRMRLAASDPDVRGALVTATEAQVSSDIETAAPARAVLLAYYAAHRDRYATDGSMRAQDWLLDPARAGDAEAIARRLAAGADPDTLGLRNTRRLDEALEFYWSARIHVGARLAVVAAQTPSGHVSAPVPLADGVHFIVMIANTPPVYHPFEAVADQVLRDYRRDQSQRLTEGNDHFLRRRADIQIAADLRG